MVALQGVTVGPEVTELMARLERDGEFAEQLFTHGLGVQAAEGLAEWLHSEVRRELGIDLDQGRRYSWGYPACPEQSEHEKVWRLLGLEEIGMTLSDGYAVMPEQSTVAIVAHHPQAVYFGMKSGFVPKEKAPDELIAGTERGGELPPERDPVAEPRVAPAPCPSVPSRSATSTGSRIAPASSARTPSSCGRSCLPGYPSCPSVASSAPTNCASRSPSTFPRNRSTAATSCATCVPWCSRSRCIRDTPDSWPTSRAPAPCRERLPT